MGKTLWIQIPCLNEEESLPTVLRQLPQNISGVEKIEILVINDGSTDKTVEVAKSLGVSHFVNFKSNRGLSAAFQAGINYCVANGADIIVNTDADNQYPGSQIAALVAPILDGYADVVIGDRKPGEALDFHPLKRQFQKLGSHLTSTLCGVKILDATSGFRAYSRESAKSIYITNPYTYTLESLVQLSHFKFKIDHIVVSKNPSTRPSRLFNSTFQYIRRNGLVLLKSYIQFAPLRFFMSASAITTFLGSLSFLPFLNSLITGDGSGHLQSIIVGDLFFICSIQLVGMAFLGDAIRAVRLSNERHFQK